MKKFLLLLGCCICCISLPAQNVINSFLEKYGGEDSLEVVSIGKKMLQSMEEVITDDPAFANAIEDLDFIRIISSSNADTAVNNEYYSTAYELLSNKKTGFEEILSLKDNEENLIVMTKGSKTDIKELILLTNGKNNPFSMILLRGKIDLKKLEKLSHQLNIKEFGRLGAIPKK